VRTSQSSNAIDLLVRLWALC